MLVDTSTMVINADHKDRHTHNHAKETKLMTNKYKTLHTLGAPKAERSGLGAFTDTILKTSQLATSKHP
jgi:hypothetical protein